ncbi:MAG: hypothetical protein K8F91_05350 [Candidatus Obscuribacterales bacterium]|nr:hypothetical protein [Candidatus Obscuribacterales bacterium]
MSFRPRDNKRKQIETWVRQYWREFYRYALLRLNNREDAEDVVQTTFIQSYRFYDDFRQKSNEKSWL